MRRRLLTSVSPLALVTGINQPMKKKSPHPLGRPMKLPPAELTVTPGLVVGIDLAFGPDQHVEAEIKQE
jgi:hypothetical protein